ncbi:MAG: 5'/3'-nucleotidase SurE [Deltaproteobacteria bacterium]|nr:5'/3'-nucleotidase SurE [Deltaproteobacteria bacterium]
MTILVSNDDGVHAPGLKALADGLACLGRVVVVAPDRERSAVGHAVTLDRPLRLRKVREDWFSVDGTPTDCVHLGIHGLLKRAPDLLVSGINEGGNLGDDLTYSGTVSIALEGCLFRVPSLAVSLVARESFYFSPAAAVARTIAEAVLANGLPPGTFLNVNVPNVPSAEALRGIRMTRQGQRVFGDGVVESLSPRGQKLYWIGARELGYVEESTGTDVEAVGHGCVSVTPVRTDLTDHDFLGDLRNWRL